MSNYQTSYCMITLCTTHLLYNALMNHNVDVKVLSDD